MKEGKKLRKEGRKEKKKKSRINKHDKQRKLLKNP